MMVKLFFGSSLALGLITTSAAASFQPPKFEWGDAWTYQISKTVKGVAAAPYRLESSTLYTVPGGSFLTGLRSSPQAAWAMSDKLPQGTCLPFVAYQQFNLDDRFCAGPIEPGSQFSKEMLFGKRVTKFEGMASIETPMGTLAAAHFFVVDAIEPAPGGKPTIVKEVRTALWYVAELRTFVRMRFRGFDSKGSLYDTVDMDLVAVKVNAPGVPSHVKEGGRPCPPSPAPTTPEAASAAMASPRRLCPSF